MAGARHFTTAVAGLLLVMMAQLHGGTTFGATGHPTSGMRRLGASIGRNLKQGPSKGSCGKDLVAAVQQNNVRDVVVSIAQGMNNASDGIVLATSAAFAQATAVAPTQSAVAVAYAAALCEAGETAQAISQALAFAVACNITTGCMVVTEARATAIANCSSTVTGDVYSYASASSTAAVIAYCALAGPDLKGKLHDFAIPPGVDIGITRQQLRKLLPKNFAAACGQKVC